MTTAFVYDETFDGFLSAVFVAYKLRLVPEAVTPPGLMQEGFGREVVGIATDDAQARRVERGIISKMGSLVHQKIYTAFLSGEPDKATLLMRYVRRGFDLGRDVYDDLAHPDVAPVEKLLVSIGRETQHLKGFVRFSRMESGVYYGRITPKNAVLELIMPHFADRFSTQPFLLHDAAHGIAGIFDLREWYLVDAGEITPPAPHEEETAYRRMWRDFCETVAIPERQNRKLRRSLLPIRYRGNMTEFFYIPEH